MTHPSISEDVEIDGAGLEPCPWCGAAAFIAPGDENGWLVGCASAHDVCAVQPSIGADTKADAIAAWNRRSASTSARLTTDEIEKIILSTEVPELSDRGDRTWTMRMATELHNRQFSSAPTSARVKPLEWVKHPSADMWRAECLLGLYQAYALPAKTGWSFNSFDGLTLLDGEAADADAAKAAAQSDYATRISSAIENEGVEASGAVSAKPVAWWVSAPNTIMPEPKGFRVEKEADDYLAECLLAGPRFTKVALVPLYAAPPISSAIDAGGEADAFDDVFLGDGPSYHVTGAMLDELDASPVLPDGVREAQISAMSIELEKHDAFVGNAVKALVWATRLYDALAAPTPPSLPEQRGAVLEALRKVERVLCFPVDRSIHADGFGVKHDPETVRYAMDIVRAALKSNGDDHGEA